MLNKIKKGLKQPLVKRMAVYALTDGLSRALPFLVMPVIAAYMTPAEFGIASTYMIFTQLIGAFISLSTNSLYSVDYYRTKPEDKAKLLSNLMAVNFGITVISMIVVALCTNIVADFFVITLQWQLLGCLMMLFSAIVDMYITYLRMEEKVKLYGRYQILRSVASAALTLLFVAVFFMSWQGRVYALVITNLVTFVLAMITFWKLNLITVKFEKEKIVEAVKFGVPLLPHKLSTWVRGGFDRIMITKKVGISDTGLYSFGGNISNAASLFVTSFFSAYTPYVYKELNLTEEETSNSAAIRAGSGCC
jgi:O-antigen/teichoic acid export membrane protein